MRCDFHSFVASLCDVTGTLLTEASVCFPFLDFNLIRRRDDIREILRSRAAH